MARKAKIKLKRGKVKFKFKSDDDVLLHGHDGIQKLLAAAMSSAMRPAPAEAAIEAGSTHRSLPAAVTTAEVTDGRADTP